MRMEIFQLEEIVQNMKRDVIMKNAAIKIQAFARSKSIQKTAKRLIF